ncbi:hypothetical protein BJX99DRAFT_232420 [Aspergillus californicus]
MPPSAPSPSSSSPEVDLESSLLTHLSTTHALEDLHSTLLSSLQRHGWTEKIRRLSLDLLRANRCERFDEVVEAVVASAQGRRHPIIERDFDSDTNGAHNGESNGDGDSFQDVDVRIPSAVVEQGVRAIKEVLREVVLLEDDGEGEKERGSIGGSGGPDIAVEIATGKGDGATGKRQGGKTNGDATSAKKEKKLKQPKTGK